MSYVAGSDVVAARTGAGCGRVCVNVSSFAAAFAFVCVVPEVRGVGSCVGSVHSVDRATFAYAVSGVVSAVSLGVFVFVSVDDDGLSSFKVGLVTLSIISMAAAAVFVQLDLT